MSACTHTPWVCVCVCRGRLPESCHLTSAILPVFTHLPPLPLQSRGPDHTLNRHLFCAEPSPSRPPAPHSIPTHSPIPNTVQPSTPPQPTNPSGSLLNHISPSSTRLALNCSSLNVARHDPFLAQDSSTAFYLEIK